MLSGSSLGALRELVAVAGIFVACLLHTSKLELNIAVHFPHQDIHNISLEVTFLPNELELDLELKQFLPFYH